MSDRGVSEVLGFALVFALITMTIGIVYASGIPGLHEAQDAEKLNNVERAFDVLADNLEDLHRNGAPSRATEVKLSGGSINTGETVTFRIRAENSSNSLDNATYVTNIEPIVYEDNDGKSILYVQGAILRSEPSGAVMLSEPNWLVGSNRTVIPQIRTFGDGGGIAGSGAVLIVTEGQLRSLQSPFEPNGSSTANVTITVETSRTGPWQRFLQNEGLDPNVTGNNVTAQFETRRLYVPKTAVRVTFNR